MAKDYTYIKKVDDDGETVLTISVTKEKFAEEKAITFKSLSTEVSLKGFRPGKGPENLIEAQLGARLYEKTLERIIPKVTFEVMQDENLNPISAVRYQVKKVAEGDSLEFSATFVEYPAIKLGNFKKIKLGKINVEVTETEVEAAIKQLVEISRKSQMAGKEKDGDKKEKKPTADSKTSSDKKAPESIKLTDEVVKKLGLGFDKLEDLRREMKKRLEVEKKTQAESKKLQDLIDEAIKISKVKVPEALIKNEIEHQLKAYKKRVEELNLKLEDFLKTQNTTVDKLKSQWRDDIEKRIATELLFIEIAKINKITIPDTEVEAETAKIADPKLKKEYDSDHGRRYITTVLLQQKAINWLKKEVEGE